MLCGDLAVMQASGFDSLSFDPFSLFQDGLPPSEVDIGRGQIIDALVIAVVVVVIHEGFNAGLKISGEEVVFQQDAVLQGGGYTLYAPFTDYLCRWFVWVKDLQKTHLPPVLSLVLCPQKILLV